MDDCTVCNHPALDHAYSGADVDKGYAKAKTHCVPVENKPDAPACTCADYRDKKKRTLFKAETA